MDFGICAGNFLSNAVKFTPSGGKLDLELQCEDVVESKDMELLALNSSSPNLRTLLSHEGRERDKWKGCMKLKGEEVEPMKP